MQLGTRWPAYTPAPQSLDPVVKQAVLKVEAEIIELNQDTSSWYWTLTFLESRPVVQLDDGTTIRVNHSGEVSVQVED